MGSGGDTNGLDAFDNAEERSFEVRRLEDGDLGSNVGLAFRKDRSALSGVSGVFSRNLSEPWLVGVWGDDAVLVGDTILVEGVCSGRIGVMAP